MSSSCHICGFPQHAQKSLGFNVTVKFLAENRMQRDRKSTVWCCTKECAIFALALSDMGPAPSKWSINLKEFAKRVKKDRLERLDSKENPSQKTENKEPSTVKNGESGRCTPISPRAFNALSLMAQGYGIDCRGMDSADQEDVGANGLAQWLGKRRQGITSPLGGRPRKYHTTEDQRKANAVHQREFRRRKSGGVEARK